MFWRRKEEPLSNPGEERRPLKMMVCRVDPGETRAMVMWLAELRVCEAVPLLTDAAGEAVPICQREKPDLLVLEAMPDAMERFDDPDKDISGRCELSARIREVLPECRVYLTCAEEFRRLEPVLQKAVETELIHGYCVGDLTRQQIEHWLDGASGKNPQQ